MKQKNKQLQSKIARLVKAGKPLGGLLAGVVATTALAGSETNAVPRLAGVPMPGKPAPVTVQTNACRQTQQHPVKGRVSRSSKEVKQLPPSIPKGKYRVVYGDTLSSIASRFGTTVEELKKLNGFDDKRANTIKVDEVISLPVSDVTTNKVNEVEGTSEAGDVVMVEMPISDE